MLIIKTVLTCWAVWIAGAFQFESVLLFETGSERQADTMKTDTDVLAGTWLLESTEYGGKKTAAEMDRHTWEVAGTRLTVRIGSTKTFAYRLDIKPQEAPKEIDLVPDKPIKDDYFFFTRTKCIYALDGHELRVAFTFIFAPGSPQEERQRAIEYAAVRPKSFDTGDGDVLVFRFKRVCKKKCDIPIRDN